MLGSIAGDIIGSIYEFHNIRSKEFPLFSDTSRFTDDTVMTFAVADAIMNGGSEDSFIDAMKKYGRLYPNVGYGGKFKQWLHSDEREPYNSWGNGSAMRVSPCAWVMDMGYYDLTGCFPNELAERSARVTHNHPEGIKGAECIADAIFICRLYKDGFVADSSSKPEISTLDECKNRVYKMVTEDFGYALDETIDEIRPHYKFDVSCQGSVPQAIQAFLESNSFEDAIRNAISIGGDSDTIACMTGGIAEAAYGIPCDIALEVLDRLDTTLREVYFRWRKFIRKGNFLML